ncbi:MAG: TolC family protein [Alphaproteobacteria bacterium]
MSSTVVRWCALVGVLLAISASGAWAADAQLSLPDALQRAQAGSPELQAADAGVQAARARARQAGLGPNPEVRLDVESFAGSGPYQGFQGAETTVGVSQQIERGGARSSRVAAATADIQVAEARMKVAQADLRRNVVDRYAEAWTAQERVRLAQETVARAEDLAKATQSMVDAGREPPLRALRARTVLASARADLRGATGDFDAARYALGALWNQPAANFTLTEFNLSPAPSAVAPSRSTLDVQLAQAELDAVHLVIERERAVATPSLTVEAGARRFSDSGDHAFVFGLSAPLPVRDRNQGTIAAAQADALAAEIRRNQAMSAAVRDELDARAALSGAEAQLAAIEGDVIPEAERALSLARLGYDAGRFSLLDVLDAEGALSEARASSVQARLARAKALSALERALAR